MNDSDSTLAEENSIDSRKSNSYSESRNIVSKLTMTKEVVQTSWVDLVLCALEYLRNKGNKTSSFNDILTTIDESSEFLHISKSDSQKERILLAVSEAVCRRLILQCKGVGGKGQYKLIKFRENDSRNLEDTLDETVSTSVSVSTRSTTNNTKNSTVDSEPKTRNKTTRRRQSSAKRPISDSDSDSMSSLNLKKGRKSSPKNISLRSNNSVNHSTRAKQKTIIKDIISGSSSDEICLSKSPAKNNNSSIVDDGDVNDINDGSDDSDTTIVKNSKFNEAQGNIIHSQPKSMEEVLPLALIFQSEPKIALLTDIINYMKKRYGITSKSDVEKTLARLVKDDKARKKGNKYELAVSEFSPDEDQTLEGKVINSIVATHKPCIAVPEEIRSYMKDFHSEVYDAAEFEESLKRAEKNDFIKMTDDSKIKLAFLFEPTPEMLRGEDALPAKNYYD